MLKVKLLEQTNISFLNTKEVPVWNLLTYPSCLKAPVDEDLRQRMRARQQRRQASADVSAIRSTSGYTKQLKRETNVTARLHREHTQEIENWEITCQLLSHFLVTWFVQQVSPQLSNWA